MLRVKLNELRLLHRRTKETRALTGDREAFGVDQVNARRAVQSELAQWIPETVLGVAKLFHAPAVRRPGVVADRLENPLTGLPAPDGRHPVVAEFVLRRDFPFQAATLAAVSQARQSASRQALVLEALIRHTNPAPAHHNQVGKSYVPQPSATDFQIGVGLRLFRARVREENEVGTNAGSRHLDQQCGRVDAQAVGDHERNLRRPLSNFRQSDA